MTAIDSGSLSQPSTRAAASLLIQSVAFFHAVDLDGFVALLPIPTAIMFTLCRMEPAAVAWVVARRSGLEICAGLEVGRLGGSGQDTGGCHCSEKGDGELHGSTSLRDGPSARGIIECEERKGLRTNTVWFRVPMIELVVWNLRYKDEQVCG